MNSKKQAPEAKEVWRSADDDLKSIGCPVCDTPFDWNMSVFCPECKTKIMVKIIGGGEPPPSGADCRDAVLKYIEDADGISLQEIGDLLGEETPYFKTHKALDFWEVRGFIEGKYEKRGNPQKWVWLFKKKEGAEANSTIKNENQRGKQEESGLKTKNYTPAPQPSENSNAETALSKCSISETSVLTEGEKLNVLDNAIKEFNEKVNFLADGAVIKAINFTEARVLEKKNAEIDALKKERGTLADMVSAGMSLTAEKDNRIRELSQKYAELEKFSNWEAEQMKKLEQENAELKKKVSK